MLLECDSVWGLKKGSLSVERLLFLGIALF